MDVAMDEEIDCVENFKVENFVVFAFKFKFQNCTEEECIHTANENELIFVQVSVVVLGGRAGLRIAYS